jgi:hypothetical protein
MKLAAVTMVYNEVDYTELWCRHFAGQVGAENCYVIDHGSDDGTTDNLGDVNVIRIPRSPYDVAEQSRLVSELSNDLLHRYDVVIHSDVDELLVADPRYHRGLHDCARAMTGPVLHAVGLDLWHLAAIEPPIDVTQPISLQRGWTWFNSALCKPVMIREPVSWSPGFHSVDHPIVFEHLYMFHLRYFDVERGLRRLEKTRSMAWANLDAGGHQRQPDEQWLNLVNGVGSLHRVTGDMDPRKEPLAPYLRRVLDSQAGREAETFKLDLGIHGNRLFAIPLRFKGRF